MIGGIMLVFSKNVLPSRMGESISFDFPEFGIAYQRYWEKDDISIEYNILQDISDTIINIPYKLDASDFKVGKVKGKEFTVYHPNHDSTHAIRQWVTAQSLLTSIDALGSGRWKGVVANLTLQEKACIRLVAFCLRIGRLNEDSVHVGSQHILRSAEMFEIIASQLGFEDTLVQNISAAMSQGKPKLIEEARYNGFSGDDNEQKLDKAKLAREVLNMVHRMDLVRCWNSKRLAKYQAIKKPIVKSLNYLLEDAEMAETLSVAYLRFACTLCEETGNKVKVVELDVDSLYKMNLKARCTESLAPCAEKLLKIKL